MSLSGTDIVPSCALHVSTSTELYERAAFDGASEGA
jgi:hypothetical protein